MTCEVLIQGEACFFTRQMPPLPQDWPVTMTSLTAPDTNKEKWIQSILNASTEGIIAIDEACIILRANNAALSMLGYVDSDSLIGENFSALSDLEEPLSLPETNVETQRTVSLQRADGSECSVDLTCKMLPSVDSLGDARTFALVLKVSSPQHLVEHKTLTQGLINASFDPIFQINQRGVIQVVNDAAVHLFGYPRDKLIGANISKLCGQGHGPKHDEYLKRYLETGEKRVIGRKRTTVARRADGSEFPIELGIQEVHLANGERAFCGFIRDLTEQTLMKQNMLRHGQHVQDQFFSSEPPPESNGNNGRVGRPRRSRGGNPSL